MERPNEQRYGYFAIARLGGVAALNIQRLIHRSPDVTWDTITSHLVFILRCPVAPLPIHLQAARTLADMLCHLRLCISTLGQFGQQVDTTIALTAAENLF